MSFLFCLHNSRRRSPRSQRERCVGGDCARVCRPQGPVHSACLGAQWSRGQNGRRAAAVGRAGFYPRDWGQVLLKTFMIHEPLNLSSERREAPPSPTGLSSYLDLHKWLKHVPRSSLCYMGPFHAGLPRPSWQALISSHKHKEHIFSVLPKQSNKSIQVTPDFT